MRGTKAEGKNGRRQGKADKAKEANETEKMYVEMIDKADRRGMDRLNLGNVDGGILGAWALWSAI